METIMNQRIAYWTTGQLEMVPSKRFYSSRSNFFFSHTLSKPAANKNSQERVSLEIAIY